MNRFHVLAHTAAVVSILVLSASSLSAWEIKTAVTDGCHEEMAVRASGFLFEEGGCLEESGPLPGGNTWKSVANELLGSMGIEIDDPWRKFVTFSLIIGARRPDDGGKSVFDIDILRDLHGNPNTQHEHCLRGPKDDYAAGDLSALENSKAFIEEQLAIAREYLELPQDAQIKKVSFYVEYYGQINVSVWAPAFHLGIASHTVQDSFSHTVRSDDLRDIRHVMNFIEAVTYDYKSDRDGLRHSMEMDECLKEAFEIAQVAEEALGEFFKAFFSDQDGAIDLFFENWMSYEAGCNNTNDFCDSKWADLARKDPAYPLFGELFGCSQLPTTGSSGAWWFVSFLTAFFLVRRLKSVAERRRSR